MEQNGYGAIFKNEDSNLGAIYYNSQMAIGEVVYSRLSEILGLPCAKADYIGDTVKSRTSIDASWVESDSDEYANQSEFDSHIILGYMLREYCNGSGFVTPENNFVKAFNGLCKWVNIDMTYHLKGINIKGIFESKVAPINLIVECSADTENTTNFLKKIANLTEEDIDKCLEMPECPMKAKITQFIRERLHEAVSTAAIYHGVLNQQYLG